MMQSLDQVIPHMSYVPDETMALVLKVCKAIVPGYLVAWTRSANCLCTYVVNLRVATSTLSEGTVVDLAAGQQAGQHKLIK